MTESTLPDLDWQHIYTPGAPTKPVLLMLHGTGGGEAQIARFAESLLPGASVLAPRGQVKEGTQLRWFRRHAEGHFDVDDVERRAADLAGFLTTARQRYQLEGREIVAIGFSNGANMALATALLHPEAVSRVVAFSGMYPLGEREVETDLSASSMLVLNGRSDPMAPLDSVSTLVSSLRARGAKVEQELRLGGHGISDTDVAAAVSWLEQIA